MTLDDAKVVAEIFSSLATPATMIAVAVMQIINFVRAGQIKEQVNKVELATNSLMDRQRVADHAAGVLEERERGQMQPPLPPSASILER